MQHEKGQVKTEYFYWQEGKKSSGYINEDDESLSNFLKDVAYVNSQMIPGANILVLFYTK